MLWASCWSFNWAVRFLGGCWGCPCLGQFWVWLAWWWPLSWCRDLAHGCQPTAQGLLAHLSLLFVPAGVGVVAQIGVLGAHGGALLAALVISTVLAIAAGALTFVAVARLMGRRTNPSGGGQM